MRRCWMSFWRTCPNHRYALERAAGGGRLGEGVSGTNGKGADAAGKRITGAERARPRDTRDTHVTRVFNPCREMFREGLRGVPIFSSGGPAPPAQVSNPCHKELLVSQCVDGVEAGGFPGGVVAEDDADRGGDDDGGDDRRDRDGGRPVEERVTSDGAPRPRGCRRRRPAGRARPLR